MSPDDVLILDKDSYQGNYSDKKYGLIILSGICTKDCLIDVFMLSASRLVVGGELILRFCGDMHFVDKIKSVATIFGFEIDRPNKIQTAQFVCIYQGPETKEKVQMARSINYADSCISLFKSVFGHSISRQFWNWKYPLSDDVKSVVALDGETVISHYGLCDRVAMYNGVQYDFLQAADVMVSPSHRGRLSSSIFSELVQFGELPFYKADTAVDLIYGFPHGRAYKLGKRLKHYQPISPIYELVFKISQPPGIIDEFFEAFPHDLNLEPEINAACLDMTLSKDVVLLQRDYNYVLRRYFYHPEYDYRVFGRDRCFFVIKVLDNKLLLMDYMGSLDDYANNLSLFTSNLSNLFPGFTLHLWCLENISDSFVSPITVVNTGAYFVCKEYSSDLPDFKNWWIMKGDTDFL